jgi:CRP/FNR family transcriptional regulator, cyclic AMP receptor protein
VSEGGIVSRDSKVDVLRGIPLFASCKDKELRDLSSLMTPLRVPAGETLMREGEFGKEFLIVVSGTATVTKRGVQLAEIGPGSYLGEISIIDGGRRTATVVAKTPMEVEILTHPEFASLLSRAPEIAVRMLPALAARIHELSEHSAD